MILQHVYLYLNHHDYPKALTTPFGFRTRYICNYIERRLRTSRFNADGFSKICIQGSQTPADDCPIVSVNAVRVPVLFEANKYETLKDSELHEFLIEMIASGIHKCAMNHRIPKLLILESLVEFRASDYRNEWVHQTKRFKEIGVRATLSCALNARQFRLTLELERSGKVVFREKVLETKPDELVFATQFKEVVFEDGHVLVVDRFAKPVFRLSLPAF